MNLKRPASLRTDQMASANVNRSQPARRRTRRMALSAPVGLSGEDKKKCSFTVPASATNLNRHGATVQLNRELLVGSVIFVRNKRGIQVSARVIAQLATVGGSSHLRHRVCRNRRSRQKFLGNHLPFESQLTERRRRSAHSMTWARNFVCFELAPTAALGSVLRPPSPLLSSPNPSTNSSSLPEENVQKLVHRQRTPSLQHWQIPPPPATNVILTPASSERPCVLHSVLVSELGNVRHRPVQR